MTQEIAHLRTDIGILIFQFEIMNSEKVNIVGSQGKDSRSYDSDLKEEEKYLDRELAGFRAKKK